MAQKNPCAKTRSKDNPYEVWESRDGWQWRVLKKCQIDDNKPFARWFCLVTTPQLPEGELGDVYVSEVKRNARRVPFGTERCIDSANGSSFVVGQTVSYDAAAPGIGRVIYKVTRVDDNGRAYGVLIENTMREMTAKEAR